MIKRCLVTGCAGFIGSNLSKFLLEKDIKVIGIDNLSTGKLEFLRPIMKDTNFEFIEKDLLYIKNLKSILQQIDFVFHFSANADVRFGIDNPRRDFSQNVDVTLRILEAMKVVNVTNIVFSSTGSVYGDTKVTPTPENSEFPIQNSMYAASKVASEGFISSFCEAYGMKSWIFRFVSILGKNYSHGHVVDFLNKLIKDSNQIEILGNGHQTKSYLNVKDCLEAIWLAIKTKNEKINIYNLGTNSYCTVNQSLDWICEELNVNPKRLYTGGNRGWIGDIPFIYLDTKKIRSLGWEPKFTIEQSIRETVSFLKNKL